MIMLMQSSRQAIRRSTPSMVCKATAAHTTTTATTTAPVLQSWSDPVTSKAALHTFASRPQLMSVPMRSLATTKSHPVKQVDLQTIPDQPFTTLHELLASVAELYPQNDIFGVKKGDKFEFMKYQEFMTLVNTTRTILREEFQIGEGDKVAIISNNRVEWAQLMYAVTSLGAQFVPMYEAQLEKDWKYIVEDSEAKLVVCANRKIRERCQHYVNTVGNVKHLLSFDELTEECDVGASLPALMRDYGEKIQSGKLKVTPALPTLTPEHCSFIIYTSGTTGLPKGVCLSHENIVSDVRGVREIMKEHLSHQTSLAFLPWAHVYGLTTELQALISTGSCLAIVPSRDEILECLGLVKPTLMLSVPMLFNVVYDGVMKNVAKQSPLKQKLFHYALSVSRKRNERREMLQPVPFLTEFQHSIFDKVVFSKIRERLGGRLHCMASGGAACPKNVLEFFDDIGIPIMEGYGLTETAPIISASGFDYTQRRLGTVGVVLPGQDVRIIDPDTTNWLGNDVDGEIIVSGPNVMIGYRNNDKANEEVFLHKDFDNTGSTKRYFRTGDMGKMVEGKFLKITGRIKEQFKLENGKYVVPAPLEDIFARGPFIQQCYLHGANMVHTVLLVVPNYPELYAYASERGIQDVAELIPYKTKAEVQALGQLPLDSPPPKAIEELFQNENFIHLITSEILRHSVRAKNFECPRVWAPIHLPFAQENQMLTPKLSLRRRNVLGAYQPIVDSMYTGKGHRIHYKPHAGKGIEM